MSPKFNINRPKIRDEEIKKHQDFKQLVERFKQQSLKKARGDESWWKNKSVRYSTVIAGVTVICTISYYSLFKTQTQQTKTNETLTTQKSNHNPPIQNKATSFVNAPSQKLRVPYSSYKVSGANGGDIVHGTSTKIKIPKNSFVDKHGRDIVGEVTIEYREFHDLGDVIASGIPMSHDSLGKNYNLESAGMFDIKGHQNGEPVFIKPEKKLEVQLASSTSEQRFNQYYLDTIQRNWKYLNKDKAIPKSKQESSVKAKFVPVDDSKVRASKLSNPKMQSLQNEIDHVIPKRIDSIGVIYNTKITKLPVPREPFKPVKTTPGKPIFKLDGNYDDFPELAAFDNVVFEVGPENKNYSKELHEVTWSDVKISQGPVKGKNYLLNLTYRNRSETLIVYPVLSGEDFNKAQKIYEQKLENYQQLAEKRRSDERKLLAEMQAKQAAYLAEQKKKQADYEKEKAALLAKYNLEEQKELASSFNTLSFSAKATRLFQVSRFGIYNSDCPHPAPLGASTVPTFVTSNNMQVVDPDFIYLVDHDLKTVYSLNKSDGFRMSFNPGNTYSICIFKKDKMYLCSKTTFKSTIESEGKSFVINLLPNTDNLADFKKSVEL